MMVGGCQRRTDVLLLICTAGLQLHCRTADVLMRCTSDVLEMHCDSAVARYTPACGGPVQWRVTMAGVVEVGVGVDSTSNVTRRGTLLNADL